MSKRPAVSVPGVLAIGAPLTSLKRDSGYASVYRPSLCLMMGVPYGRCILLLGMDQSLVCKNLGFLWSQGQVSA